MTEPGHVIANVGDLAKPATKLIDAVRAAIGVAFEPARIRRKAKADADALIISTHAEITRGELLYRAAQRIGAQEERRQENIEAVVDEAMGALPPAVSEAPVDPDWMSQFFTSAQDVATPELQRLWAKILA